MRGPRAVLAYLRGRRGPAIGHNPLGGWSVIAMLVLLSVQAGLGLFASDEDAVDAGPLSDWVSFESAQRLLENHETLFNVLLVLIGVHILAVVYYLAARRQSGLADAERAPRLSCPVGAAAACAAVALRRRGAARRRLAALARLSLSRAASAASRPDIAATARARLPAKWSRVIRRSAASLGSSSAAGA